MKAPEVDFRDVAAQAGLTTGGSDFRRDRSDLHIVENTGTGVAIFDYDNDGLPDIFLQGDRLHNLGPPLHAASLSQQGWASTLRMSPPKAGIGHLGWSQGVCAGDADNDGHVDLFIGQWGHNVFLHNIGDGTFRDERRSNVAAWTGRNHDGAQGAPLSITIATAISTWWWPIMLTLKPRKPWRSRDKSGCNWKGMPVPCGPRGPQGRDDDAVSQRRARSFHRCH